MFIHSLSFLENCAHFLMAEMGKVYTHYRTELLLQPRGGGGALGYFLGGYVPPGTPNWHPVLKKISPKIDTPF